MDGVRLSNVSPTGILFFTLSSQVDLVARRASHLSPC